MDEDREHGFRQMKHLQLTTIAAVVLVGCGPSAPDISIHYAARTGDIEAVKQHIAAGTDVNAKVWDGTTPLLLAAAGGRKEIVELLIAAGADVNAKRGDGETPLDHARGETFDLLRIHGGKTKKELEATGK